MRADRVMSAVRQWAAPAVPLARVAVLRTAIYLFVLFDIAKISNGAFSHGDTPVQLYQPLGIRKLFHLPVPSHDYVRVLAVVIVVSALVAATGKLPRLAGWVCAAGMLDWVSNNFSYGKIDHDHTALMIALLVLPTVGRARYRDTELSESAGWALRCIQIGVVATYFLSAAAKIRFGGWGWPSSAIFTWAFVRRGTPLAQRMLDYPFLVVASQWALIILETLSPVLLFLRGKVLYLAIAVFGLFHLSTYLLLKIHFLPLVICLLAFLPLERLVPASASTRAARGQRTPWGGTRKLV
ncbi:hypothetical protein ACPPVT_09830 [Angustibacter sp. McL0619]|uniref:hypothetical protein n=1 Tax=Angustibacter sp. McL0619 TaxID=3415676 RepID=UPI003CEC5CD1